MAWSLVSNWVEEAAVIGQQGDIPYHTLPPSSQPSTGPKAFSGVGMGILRLSTLPTPILSKRMMTRRYVSHVSAPSIRPLDVG